MGRGRILLEKYLSFFPFFMEPFPSSSIIWNTARPDSIAITHQEIMAEFGTSREIITRILKDFYASGMISASRG